MDISGLEIEFQSNEEAVPEAEEKTTAETDNSEQTRKTYVVTEALDRALRLKAANEGRNLNEVVRDCFYQSIEPKYFKSL